MASIAEFMKYTTKLFRLFFGGGKGVEARQTHAAPAIFLSKAKPVMISGVSRNFLERLEKM